MKLTTTIIFVFCLYVTTTAQQLFNDGWQFYKGDTIVIDSRTNSETGWRSVTLPHDWSIEGPFSEQWASATGFLPGGIGWYKKVFATPPGLKQQKLFIYFDGVYKNSTVWLNGHLLGNRPNGFIPFEYELTPFLERSGDNVLAVKADHAEFADSRWYTGSGIYRNVYLSLKSPVHIATWGVQFTTPIVSANHAFANTLVTLVNQTGNDEAVTIKAELLNQAGKPVAKDQARLTATSHDSSSAKLQFNVNNPALWSAEDPNLYTLKVTVDREGKTIDAYNGQVGFRSFRMDADSGFFLNGNNIKLKGVCLHDDAGALGVAVPQAVWRRRLQYLKELGCNSIRMSHNPHAGYLYDLCDEMGFLVLDEAFDEWEYGKNKWIQGWNVGTPGKAGYHEYFSDWSAIDLRDMILRNFNHPSIIAWSIGNEIDYPNDPYSSEVLSTGNNPQIYGKGYLPDHPPAERLGVLSKQLADVVRIYDTTRPVTAALAGVVMSNQTSYPANLDWVGYNYQEYRYAEDHKTYPNRKIHGSENGMRLSAWNAVDSNQYIPAQYLWTGIDYMGEAGRWPQRSNGAGLLDLAGFPKPEYYFRQSLWSAKPMIHLGATKAPNEDDSNIWRHLRAEPTWNWDSAGMLRINCFTNCDEAELYLNGRSIGRKKLADFPARFIYWNVEYEPGVLKVAGYNNGKAIVLDSLVTTGKPAALKATTIKDTVGKTNLVHVVIEVVDKAGNIVYDANPEISLSLAGDAGLLGLESGSSTSHEDYKSNRRKAQHGKLLAYIRLKDGPGPVTVTISSPGLRAARVKLK